MENELRHVSRQWDFVVGTIEGRILRMGTRDGNKWWQAFKRSVILVLAVGASVDS
jgi:hypothetical protein